MWKNSELKQNAKDVLSRFGYWLPFLVCFVGGMLSASLDSVFSVLSETPGYEELYESEYSIIFSMLPFFVLILSVLFTIFIGNPIKVGMNRFFMENRIFGSKIERLFWSFISGRYLNIVKTMFLLNLKVLLWSFLLIIPGIIKSYEYFMVPYILAENPKISSKRAFELSKEMTRDEKFDIFFLELSFTGWIILGSITCGIGLLFMEPYYQATFAELYQVMREKAHSQNFSDFNELPGFLPEQQ